MKNRTNINERKQVTKKSLYGYGRETELESDAGNAFTLKESILKAKAQGLIAGYKVTLYNQKRIKNGNY